MLHFFESTPTRKLSVAKSPELHEVLAKQESLEAVVMQMKAEIGTSAAVAAAFAQGASGSSPGGRGLALEGELLQRLNDMQLMLEAIVQMLKATGVCPPDLLAQTLPQPLGAGSEPAIVEEYRSALAKMEEDQEILKMENSRLRAYTLQLEDQVRQASGSMQRVQAPLRPPSAPPPRPASPPKLSSIHGCQTPLSSPLPPPMQAPRMPSLSMRKEVQVFDEPDVGQGSKARTRHSSVLARGSSIVESPSRLEVGLRRNSLDERWGLLWEARAYAASRRVIQDVVPESPAGLWNQDRRLAGLRPLLPGDELLKVQGQGGPQALSSLPELLQATLVFSGATVVKEAEQDSAPSTPKAQAPTLGPRDGSKSELISEAHRPPPQHRPRRMSEAELMDGLSRTFSCEKEEDKAVLKASLIARGLASCSNRSIEVAQPPGSLVEEQTLRPEKRETMPSQHSAESSKDQEPRAASSHVPGLPLGALHQKESLAPVVEVPGESVGLAAQRPSATEMAQLVALVNRGEVSAALELVRPLLQRGAPGVPQPPEGEVSLTEAASFLLQAMAALQADGLEVTPPGPGRLTPPIPPELS